MMKRSLFVLLLLLITVSAYPKDRCQDYVPDVREASIQYLGLQYPYWYNIGIMIAESNCRPDIVSFDGGIGLYQFTPSTGVTAELERYIDINPSNPKSSIRAQAFYMSRIREVHFAKAKVSVGKGKNPAKPATFVSRCGSNIADTVRFYNGGYWFFWESELGGWDCVNREMFKHCVRGGTYTDKKKTKWLSFCEVNYSYPEKVYKYAQPYRRGEDGMRYWYVIEE
jgi:hypothetical protein